MNCFMFAPINSIYLPETCTREQWDGAKIAFGLQLDPDQEAKFALHSQLFEENVRFKHQQAGA